MSTAYYTCRAHCKGGKMKEGDLAKENHLYWIDFARVIAIILVIQIHVSGIILPKWESIPFAQWMTGNLFDSFARVGTPLFFMLSGATLLSKQEKALVFFQKRASKIIVPFIFWTLIYWFWKEYPQADLMIGDGFLVALKTMLIKPTSYHLWFFYALIGLYVLTPILRHWVLNVSEREIYFFVFIWFVLGPCLQAAKYFYGISISPSIDYSLSSNIIFTSLGYFLLGNLLGRREKRYKKDQILGATFLYLAISLLTAFGTLVLTGMASKVDVILYDIYLPHNVLATASLFVVLKSAGEKIFSSAHPLLMTIIRIVSSATFGVYLIHVMILESLADGMLGFKVSATRLLYPSYQIPVYYGIPITIGATFLISFIIVCILQQIPIVRKIVT